MRAFEFISESKPSTIGDTNKKSLVGVNTYDKQNMNSGDLYLHWRMGIALAGAPDFPTPSANFIGGNPLFHASNEVEQEMLDYAAKQIGDTSGKKYTSNKSEETEHTHKVSPVRKTRDYRKPIKN